MARSRPRARPAGRSAIRTATISSRAIRTVASSAYTRRRATMTTSTETAGTGAQAGSEAGFDLSLTEEQALVQKTAREFAREKVLPRAAEIDENKKVPAELIREMGALGFMG